MTAGEGHIFGWEDILKERIHSTSVHCISNYAQILKIPSSLFKQEVNQDEFVIEKLMQDSKKRDICTYRQIYKSKLCLKKLNQTLGPNGFNFIKDKRASIQFNGIQNAAGFNSVRSLHATGSRMLLNQTIDHLTFQEHYKNNQTNPSPSSKILKT